MDLISLFTNALTGFGLFLMVVLLIAMGLLHRKKALTSDSRAIFLLMFIIVALFVVITYVG
jgi:hypothetical protein